MSEVVIEVVVRMVAGFDGVVITDADPSVNLALGDGSGDQVVPHLAINPDGSCYTGWYDNSSGNTICIN